MWHGTARQGKVYWSQWAEVVLGQVHCLFSTQSHTQMASRLGKQWQQIWTKKHGKLPKWCEVFCSIRWISWKLKRALMQRCQCVLTKVSTDRSLFLNCWTQSTFPAGRHVSHSPGMNRLLLATFSTNHLHFVCLACYCVSATWHFLPSVINLP